MAISGSIGLSILFSKLVINFSDAPKLKVNYSSKKLSKHSNLTIIIPTYNEELNIESCLSSVLLSEDPCKSWSVILADDCSDDRTMELARKKAQDIKGANNKLKIISAGERPRNEKWVGKNWPCYQAMKLVETEWVLFIDADIQLQKFTLKRALMQSIEEDIDLLSIAPRLKCGCLSEWMVQPIIASLLGLNFPFNAINDSSSSVSFAAGPFMLFRKSSYLSIGGHECISGEVVEDLALARRIKRNGFKLFYLLGLDAIDLRMYQDFSSLWEGWSKNWFIGLDRNVLKALFASLSVFLMFSIPWLLFPSIIIYTLLVSRESSILLASLILGGTGIFLQFSLRSWIKKAMGFPLKHWWLMGIGGIILGILGPTSIIKTITGKGWTWKGRSLSQKNISDGI